MAREWCVSVIAFRTALSSTGVRLVGSIPCASIRSTSSRGGGIRIDKDLVAASATPLVLAILAEGESYGYAILSGYVCSPRASSSGPTGCSIPLLHRLRRLGYVTTEWRTPPEGRRRQYYMLTDDGRAALATSNGNGGP